ncbi:histidine kinase [Desulfovibrio sp. X2]|uniref:histidine kinase dimerization/phospho-acceptor domain-containing protein n=1 Tax=Desulfovibrio sp. X2 TaxID=941449 RepID=UPI000358CE6E|nr:histidine kinase dimerization/phospho-acceptor domain-containing protein [Desulfovibrio sp. X2]EPR42662.1 histidine kinase [Desulfovibrio sp. X2]
MDTLSPMLVTHLSPPLTRLRFFREQLGISPGVSDVLAPWRQAFLGRKEAMSEFLYRLISGYAQTKIVLQHQTSEERLRHNWQGWYERLWQDPQSDEFLSALWRSGTRHVQYGVDHRFISLAYSHVHRFCEAEVRSIVPQDEQAAVAQALNGLFDLCLLVETDAFINSASRCDLDVMAGVAHQIRNPLMIIGGNAAALMRSAAEDTRARQAGETIIDEAKRLERMVKNVGVYVTTLSREPVFAKVEIEPLLQEMVELLRGEKALDGCRVSLELDPEARVAEADRETLLPLFYHLLQNAAEATDPGDPRLTITSRPSRIMPGFVELRIFNTGDLPKNVSEESLFLPFHSSKAYGTGFGLPIARLAARKNFGTVELSRAPDKGTYVDVVLPGPGAVDASGLFVKT